MTLKDAIYGRRSIRKFKQESVPLDIIKSIIDAGIQAPSACNYQNWKFIIVNDEDRKLYANEILANAPTIIFVCYRSDINNVSGYKHKDYVQSAAAAIENMLLMAYEKQIGACWVCDIPDNEVLQKHFKIPEYYEVLAAVAIGYEDEKSNSDAQKMFHAGNETEFEKHTRKYSVEQCTYLGEYGIGFDGKITEKEKIEKGNCVRDYWIECMKRIARPVIENCANGNLHETMPLRGKDIERAKKYAHLEALGRTILGISCWLESSDYSTDDEQSEKELYRIWARQSISNAVNPASSDYMNWNNGDQPLVDAAFLALGILQAKNELWEKLDEESKSNLLIALKSTRRIAPWRSNWILFSSMIEVFVLEMEGESECIKSVIDYGISQFEQWYIGDGFYKDGDNFHFDYYESIVIHPFLIEIANRVPWIINKDRYISRALRYSKILVSFISDDGSFPMVGRSLCYRGGVLHVLAKMSSMGLLDNEELPENIFLKSNVVRTSMMSVLNRFMAGNILDEDGWLKIGVINEQIEMAEEYINTGSLYIFLTMFMATGLPSEHNFWIADKESNYSTDIWNGKNISCDTSLEGWKRD